MCLWEIALGHVKIFATPLESRVLLVVIDVLQEQFTDVVNAPANEFSVPIDPDCEKGFCR